MSIEVTTVDPSGKPVAVLPAMTEEEIAQALAISPEWPYPGDMDGWKVSHNAIRADIKDLREAVDAVMKGLEGGKALEPWQADNLAKYWPVFYKMVHDHHDHEELIFFPYLEKKFKLPPKMSSDHKTLMALLDRCGDDIKAIKAGGNLESDKTAVAALQADLAKMEEHMLPHLLEEEEQGLPRVRQQFTHAEMAVPVAEIVKVMTLMDIGWILRPMEPAERKKWLDMTVEAPAPVKKFLMLPHADKYIKKIQIHVDELKAGEQQPKGGLFACLGC